MLGVITCLLLVAAGPAAAQTCGLPAIPVGSAAGTCTSAPATCSPPSCTTCGGDPTSPSLQAPPVGAGQRSGCAVAATVASQQQRTAPRNVLPRAHLLNPHPHQAHQTHAATPTLPTLQAIATCQPTDEAGYGCALNSSLTFYTAVRAGKLPVGSNPYPWRGDTLTNDTLPNGMPLQGGW